MLSSCEAFADVLPLTTSPVISTPVASTMVWWSLSSWDLLCDLVLLLDDWFFSVPSVPNEVKEVDLLCSAMVLQSSIFVARASKCNGDSRATLDRDLLVPLEVFVLSLTRGKTAEMGAETDWTQELVMANDAWLSGFAKIVITIDYKIF